jgi:hypothetical protein
MQIGGGHIAGCAKNLLSKDKNFLYDSARAICNFADKHLWFSSGLRCVIRNQLLRDSARRVFLAQCHGGAPKAGTC